MQKAWWVVGLCLFVMLPGTIHAAAIDLTRFVGHHAREASFFGVPGSARLIVTRSGAQASVSIRLNGTDVVVPSDGATLSAEIPVTLGADNIIAVAPGETSTGQVSVRVKQTAEVASNVTSRVHFNTNVSNFAAARAFYGKLGFETLTGFPDTNTQAMARAIGVTTPTAYDGSQGGEAGGYLLHGELIGLPGFKGGLIDLIEFTIPRRDAPPYARLNHLGMARAAMYTTNITADYDYMKGIGVEFIAAPTARADGARFAIFKDLDGTYYELIEAPGTQVEKTADRLTHIQRLAHVSINVSDLERSTAWYQMLGYQVSARLPSTKSIEVARAMGFDEPFEIDGVLITHPQDGSTLQLVQWIAPYDPERASPLPVNHLGIGRIALATDDIAADVAALKAQGVEFVSEVTPCCSGPDSWGRIVAFYDPDGAIIELVEQPFIGKLMPVLMWLRGLF